MISVSKDVFEGSEFVIQLIAKGAYVDNGIGDGHSYLVEAYMIRLNHIALNAWTMSETLNSRLCYDTDEEWEAHKAEYAEKREAWNEQIINAIGLINDGSINISQSQSEVFTVVHITKIA